MPWVWSYPGLHSKFQASLSSRVKCCLKRGDKNGPKKENPSELSSTCQNQAKPIGLDPNVPDLDLCYISNSVSLSSPLLTGPGSNHQEKLSPHLQTHAASYLCVIAYVVPCNWDVLGDLIHFYSCFVLIEPGWCFVVRADSEFAAVFQPEAPECWDYRPVPPCWFCFLFLTLASASLVLGWEVCVPPHPVTFHFSSSFSAL